MYSAVLKPFAIIGIIAFNFQCEFTFITNYSVVGLKVVTIAATTTTATTIRIDVADYIIRTN